MNLFYLRYFVTLAEVKHYTKAAQELCITQPSLSHAIMQLEKELGVCLFEKSGRNTTLTRFGEEFLVCARKTLETLDDGVEAVRKSACGEGLIRLGFVRPLGIDFVPKLASEYIEQNKGKNIQFTFHSDITGHLLDALSQHRYDILFCSQPPKETGFAYKVVKKQKLVLITPKDHELAALSSVSLYDVKDYPFIAFAKESGIRSVIDSMFEECDITPNIVYETEEDQVIAGMSAYGMGIAIVPYMDILHKMNVKILDISHPSYNRNFCMVYDDKIYTPPVVNDFMRYVEKKCNSGEKESCGD